MTTWQERERAFEAKYAHDEEFRFLVTARRDKLFAQWAAEQLGLSEEDRAGLTASVLAVRDGAGHDERLLEHMAQTFNQRGRSLQTSALAAALDRAASQARQQLLEQPHPPLV